MYFIPRNNKIYNYIAHTSSMYRYSATFITLCSFFMIGFYFVYYPLLNIITRYSNERCILQKKYEEIAYFDKSSKDLRECIDTKKNSIQTYVKSCDSTQHYYNQMALILQAVAQFGLSLHSYGFSKQKEKKWYIKNSAHFEISGSTQKLMMFLQSLSTYQEIFVISDIIFTHKTDDLFHMSFNLSLMSIKKIV